MRAPSRALWCAAHRANAAATWARSSRAQSSRWSRPCEGSERHNARTRASGAVQSTVVHKHELGHCVRIDATEGSSAAFWSRVSREAAQFFRSVKVCFTPGSACLVLRAHVVAHMLCLRARAQMHARADFVAGGTESTSQSSAPSRATLLVARAAIPDSHSLTTCMGICRSSSSCGSSPRRPRASPSVRAAAHTPRGCAACSPPPGTEAGGLTGGVYGVEVTRSNSEVTGVTPPLDVCLGGTTGLGAASPRCWDGWACCLGSLGGREGEKTWGHLP